MIDRIETWKVRWDMEGTEPTKHYTLLYVKDMTINCEVHIYLCITKPHQQLELSIVDFDKELVREDFFKPKNHDEGSISCKLDKYILSFPRTWNT
jgi:hypothetical protein